MRNMFGKLTYSNVMATIAIFVALGGASYAAVGLPRDSVGSKQIRDQAVGTAKIRDGAVTGSKVDLSSLGTVPNASHATNADFALQAKLAGTANFAGKAQSAGDSNELGGQPPVAFATVFTSHMNIESTATKTRRWGAVTGISPTAASSEDVELLIPYWSPTLYASNFTVFSRKGSGESGHVDVRLYVNEQATQLFCPNPGISVCIMPKEDFAKVEGGSVLAISVHEEPEGSEIPAFPLEVSFQLGPKPS